MGSEGMIVDKEELRRTKVTIYTNKNLGKIKPQENKTSRNTTKELINTLENISRREDIIPRKDGKVYYFCTAHMMYYTMILLESLEAWF